MLTLRSMTATFGGLKGEKKEFSPGLNLIHAPNEGGKTTWSAFYKAMLFGIDTRDRDKKGHLAVKNKYQPWSGAPMEGELVADWNGREVAIRRGPRGNTPFGTFSAVYTDTGEKIPGMTGDNCGEMLTGVSREVFERSAFIGGQNMALTSAPDLERRLSSLLTAGEEDVSFSQVQSTLKGWLNQRRVNRSVGLIPKLEEELAQVRADLSKLEDQTRAIAQLESEQKRLKLVRQELLAEEELHRKIAQRELNTRFAQADQDYTQARAKLEKLEEEFARFGELPPHEQLKEKQFDLQYLKVLDEEIKAAEADLDCAEEEYIQAQRAAQDDRFTGLSAAEARSRVEALEAEYQSLLRPGGERWFAPLLVLAVLCAAAALVMLVFLPQLPRPVGIFAGCLSFMLLSAGVIVRSEGSKRLAKAAALSKKFEADTMEELKGFLADYEGRCAAAQARAQRCREIHGALNDRRARKENTRRDIFDFVHTFAPEVKELFGCSAALSRALNLEHELEGAQEGLRQRKLRRDDLEGQGGQLFQTLELLYPPERSPEETGDDLAAVTGELAMVDSALNRALGQRSALGDPAALYARVEELEGELTRRSREFEAISLAMEQLEGANQGLQRRFSPRLNALSGELFGKLTGARYDRVSLSRELEGEVSPAGEILPRSALYLSKGTADQLYLAVRLAVCKLCLPDDPPILLDDALANFDDERLKLALKLLKEMAQGQQILLFTCHRREGETLEVLA